MYKADTDTTYTVVKHGGVFALCTADDPVPLYTSGDADKVIDLMLDTCTGTTYTEEYQGCHCSACKARALSWV